MISRMTSLAALLLAGCAHAESGGATTAQAPLLAAAPPQIGVTPRNSIVPMLDAHQHMMGPAAMSTLRLAPTPPAVTVPAALAELLAARQSGVDAGTYDALFTADAQVFSEDQGRWWMGRDRALKAVGDFGTGRHFIPTSFAAEGSSGYVSGILRPTTGDDTHNFVLGIRKGSDGRWRIASEMKQRIMPRVYAPMVGAERIIEVLDDAGIRYATVLSTAYWFGDPDKDIAEADRVTGTRAENDWVVAETRKYPDRLIPFCGVNPVADYAIAEMERCHALGVRGMKIHRNSKWDPARPADLERLKLFFRTANRLRMAIVLHFTRDGPRAYIDHVFPEAPDIPIQIAHMGSGWPNAEMLADAIAAGKPGTRNLWFDWTQALPIENLWSMGGPTEGVTFRGTYGAKGLGQVADVMRKLGLHRILYGSDMALAWNPNPREWWRRSLLRVPLTDDEIRNIADNLPPYVPQ